MIYRFGDHELDTEGFRLSAGGDEIPVEPQVFALLQFLIENSHRVVSKDAIFEHVWDGRIVSDGTLNSRINSARRAVGDDGKAQAVIKTFPRRGFRFVATLSGDDDAGPTPEPTTVLDKPSIAVLPFHNLSNDPEQEYFSDGMAEDLITDISKISGLFVIARNSSFAFKGQSVNVKIIAEQLGVKHILEGSVRKMGPKLRVNVQLIDAASGGHIWAERYDGEMENIFEFQDDIRDQIVAALQVSLTPADNERSELRRTESVKAYDLFLKGRTSYFQYTAENHREAKSFLEQAIEIDPNFADAYSYLSYCHCSSWIFMWPGRDDDMERAIVLAEKGVALDPDSAMARTRLAWVQGWHGNFDKAIEVYEKALSLEPDNAEVYAYFGETLNFTEQLEKATQLLQKAFQLEPLSPPSWDFMLGHSLYELRRYDEAVVRFLRCLDRAPSFPVSHLYLACAYVEMGRMAEANEQIRALLAKEPRYSLERLGRIYLYRNKTNRQRFFNNLGKAGLPEF